MYKFVVNRYKSQIYLLSLQHYCDDGASRLSKCMAAKTDLHWGVMAVVQDIEGLKLEYSKFR